MCLIIISHDDYSYLWKIIEDKIKIFTSFNTIFYCNAGSLNDKPSGFKKYLEYNDKDKYSERLISLLQNNTIDDDYIIIVHDIHIIVNCNLEKLTKLINIIRKNNIDRCSLNVFDGSEIIHDEIIICNLNNTKIRTNTFIPYDVGPTIWNKHSFLKLWKTFPNMSYRESELNNNIQNYCKKLKCYGIQKTSEKIYYCLGRPYPSFFNVLIITIKGEITFPYEVYMDARYDFEHLFNKYNLKDKIKINSNYNFLLSSFNPI